jgi:hypothetical protein
MYSFKAFLEESINESLADAMKDLVDRIGSDGYTKGLEKEVADDWDIKPELLTRMFKQKYNKEPSEMSISKDDSKVIEAAKRKAKEYRNQFSGQFDKYVGKIFERPGAPGKRYVFVAWTGKDIHMITIPDQKEMRLVFNNAQSAQSFLEKNIIN